MIHPIRWYRKIRARWRIKRLYKDLLQFNVMCKRAGYNRHELRRVKRRLLKDMNLAKDMVDKMGA